MKKIALPLFVVSVLISVALIYYFASESKRAINAISIAMQPSEPTVVFVAEPTVVSDSEPSVVSAAEPTVVFDSVVVYDAATSQTDVMLEVEPQPSSFIENMQPINNADLDAVSAQYDAVGVQCAVIEDGFVSGYYVYGMADVENDKAVTQDTKYRIASLSKLFTNMIFMSLADSGAVSPDADISDYYGFTVRNPYYSDTPITARMLMLHTASIADGSLFNRSLENYSSIPIYQLLNSRSSYSSYQPGTVHSYSNFSNALVGSVCETVSDTCFEDLAQSLFLEPMQIDAGYMASTIEDRDAIGLLYGGSSTLQSQLYAQFSSVKGQTIHLTQGNLTISATDYAQLLCMLLNDGRAADGTRLLSSESASEFLRVQFNSGSELIGLGSFISENVLEGRTVFTHTGSAYGMYSCYMFDPATKDGVVVLTSGARYATDPQTGIYSICLDLSRALMPVAD